MLSDSERRRIEGELERYPNRRALSVEALKIVQQERGWVSDEALADVAELLGMSCAELDGVATFYNQIHRRPVGVHVVQMCDGVTCWMLGYEGLRRRAVERLGVDLGGTTTDGRFTLLPTPCLGACDVGPALMVDGDLHRNVEPDDLEKILDGYAGPAED
jgi:NADH-quinone oxidoreductase subunit E